MSNNTQDNNIIEHKFSLDLQTKQKKYNSQGSVLWFTGLSGSGKSTIANKVEKLLFENNSNCIILDGDSIRTGLCNDLGFAQEDRTENIRRVAEVAKLLKDNAMTVICCFVSPLIEQRQQARDIIGDNFIECQVYATFELCAERDPKGLYKKNIKNFSGKDSQYQEPESPEIKLDTTKYSAQELAQQAIRYLQENKLIN